MLRNILAVTGAILVLGVALIGAFWQPAEKPFTSKSGRFRIQFSGQPIEAVTQTPNGETTSYRVESREVMRGVSVMSLVATPPDVEGYLDDAVEAFVAEPRMRIERVRSQTKVAQGSHPGREIRAVGFLGEMRIQLFYAPGRLYQVVVMGHAADVDSDKSDQFFASFAILDS